MKDHGVVRRIRYLRQTSFLSSFVPRLLGRTGAYLDPVEVVAEVYRAVLRREPDQAGFEKYVAEIRSGRPRLRDVVETILYSKEAGWNLLSSGFLIAFPEMLWDDQKTHPRRTQLCFMHMMKTGGTSLTEMLSSIFPGFTLTDIVAADQLIVLPPAMLNNVSMASGHFSYEAVERFFPGAAVCTVLRDPLKRAMSHYAHLCRDEQVRREHPNLTLEEFVESPEWQPLHTNYQARHLVHRIDLHRAWLDYSPVERLTALGATSPRHRAAPIQGLFEATPMSLEGAALEKAAVGQLESLEFVGVTEHLADVAARVALHYGSEAPAITYKNSGGRHLKRRELPASLARRLREANAADYACYEYALSQVTALRRSAL
jgi:uncharacterized protein DUF4214